MVLFSKRLKELNETTNSKSITINNHSKEEVCYDINGVSVIKTKSKIVIKITC